MVISLKSTSSCPTVASMALKRAVLVPSDPKPKDGKMKMLVGRVAATYLRKLKKSGSGPVSR